ncbi:SDR family NAD(P)-dependent oxidoreductase [Corynebacterium halotolerans]|uniref:Short-chain dehydrogenase/reductase SDR n=1 Tax=Corynebacterium halotolerans YIM 70093 = DSM 44683 TaxID=1121362 RepID=M1NKZ0_9CORY|nr:SDR family NAD(P)-dependent oxidoreductase [Corynebacterium halotolerans]AGF72053.1 short-chain dehydrogenase/reductase SDR [Corynebacterium halotolerans YIM 70093 = DSM 44683]
MSGPDRTVLITGATGGLGHGLARALSGEPGRLILHGRNPDRLADLRSELAGATATVETVTADLSEQAQVHALATQVADLTDHLHVLVNNAGVGPGRGDRRELSPDGVELRLAVNHLAPFALSLLLLPLLRRGAPARIVNVASAAQQEVELEDLHLRHGYSGSRAYAQSKLAMVAAGFELAEHLDPAEVTVNSLHPATLMPTAMVHEGWGHTIDELSTGIAATRRLIDAPELAGVSGRYFSGTREARALPQAQDPRFRRRLWEISSELTGTRL